MLGANARRPLALCQAAPDAASCFLPARAPRGERCSSLSAAGRRRRGLQGTARSGVPGADLGKREAGDEKSTRPLDARRRQAFPPLSAPAATRLAHAPCDCLVRARFQTPAPACGTDGQSQTQACAYLYLKSAVFPARAQGQGGGHIGQSLATSVTKLKFDCWVSLDYFKVILRYL